MKTLRTVATVVGLVACASANATLINWNTWSSATAGSIAANSVTVSFSAGGSTDTLVGGYPSYTPTTTYADGTIVDNAPTSANGIIRLAGGNSNINVITFSKPVVDPVMAIWSLGQPGIQASFDFLNATPTFVAGGPSNEYGGSSISVSGNRVLGNEGNGTVRFIGTYSDISWRNPTYEYWYGYNVGIAGVAAPIPTPEPSELALFGLGLAILGRKRKRKV